MDRASVIPSDRVLRILPLEDSALNVELVTEVLKRGATDYVLKDKLDRLPGTVLRALSEARERGERKRAQDALQQMRQVLGRMKERMQALAAAHCDLYDGQGSARFDASRFAKGLCEELTASVPNVRIAPEFEIENVEVEAAKAAPMALLFNEIVVKALTHAYNERRGKLKLTLRIEDGVLLFQLSDHAFSQEEKQVAKDSASGTILKALSRQLDAQVEWPLDDPAILVRVTMPIQDGG